MCQRHHGLALVWGQAGASFAEVPIERIIVTTTTTITTICGCGGGGVQIRWGPRKMTVQGTERLELREARLAL